MRRIDVIIVVVLAIVAFAMFSCETGNLIVVESITTGKMDRVYDSYRAIKLGDTIIVMRTSRNVKIYGTYKGYIPKNPTTASSGIIYTFEPAVRIK